MSPPSDEMQADRPSIGTVGDRTADIQRDPAEARPRASVVICVYNRADSVLATLESVRDCDFDDFEIVAVDDASTDASRQVLEKFRDTLGDTPMTIVHNDRNLGVAGARNSGVEAARGEIVLFTDSDCTVEPDWIAQHQAVYADPEISGACGVVVDATPTNWAEVAYAGTTRVGANGVQKRLLVGGNMSFRREVLLALEFDLALRYGCDEDDLAWRMTMERLRIVFVPEARVCHLHPLVLRSLLQMAFQQGKGSARFWFKKGIYLGRDVAALAAAVVTLPLALVDSGLLLVPLGLLALQALALLYSEVVFKRKGLGAALVGLPLLLIFSLVKLAGVAAVYSGLLLGGEPLIRESKRAWVNRKEHPR